MAGLQEQMNIKNTFLALICKGRVEKNTVDYYNNTQVLFIHTKGDKNAKS